MFAPSLVNGVNGALLWSGQSSVEQSNKVHARYDA